MRTHVVVVILDPPEEKAANQPTKIGTAIAFALEHSEAISLVFSLLPALPIWWLLSHIGLA